MPHFITFGHDWDRPIWKTPSRFTHAKAPFLNKSSTQEHVCVTLSKHNELNIKFFFSVAGCASLPYFFISVCVSSNCLRYFGVYPLAIYSLDPQSIRHFLYSIANNTHHFCLFRLLQSNHFAYIMHVFFFFISKMFLSISIFHFGSSFCVRMFLTQSVPK